MSIKPKLEIVTLCGSMRKESFNAALVRQLPDIAPGDMIFKEGPAVADIPIYDGDLETMSGFPAPITALAGFIREADGVVITSPEYNYSVPGGLKNLLDWVSRTPKSALRQKTRPHSIRLRWTAGRRAHAASSASDPRVSQCAGSAKTGTPDRPGDHKIQPGWRADRPAIAGSCSPPAGRICQLYSRAQRIDVSNLIPPRVAQITVPQIVLGLLLAS